MKCGNSCFYDCLLLIGRIFISAIFIIAAIGKIMAFSATSASMMQHGVPYANVLLIIGIIVEMGGGLLVLFGWYARLGALLLFLFIIPVTYFFHSFWTYTTISTDAVVNTVMFFKNLAMMGGLLYVMVIGAGRISLDGCCRKVCGPCKCGPNCKCCSKEKCECGPNCKCCGNEKCGCGPSCKCCDKEKYGSGRVETGE